MKKHRNEFLRDAGIVMLSILVAVILLQTKVLTHLLTSTAQASFLNSFIAGFFFTSVFTTAPAIAALAEISLTHSIFWTAFFGALGAMCGDYIIFTFFRDHLAGHVSEVVQIRGMQKRFKALLKLRFFRWFTFLLGGLIIASPLPDELGLALLGFSKTRTSWFLPLSFVFNFLGIYLIGIAARAIL